jgi:hypothetical protein
MQVSRNVDWREHNELATQKAANLRTSLMRYYGRLRVPQQYLPHILSTSHRRIIQWFVARGGYIFDYFQEIATAAQYVVLGLKVQRTVGDLAMENFLDREDITKWELEAVEMIGTRATIDLTWFIFENAWGSCVTLHFRRTHTLDHAG